MTKIYPRFTLWSLKRLPIKDALRMWYLDLKLGWHINGWRTFYEGGK